MILKLSYDHPLGSVVLGDSFCLSGGDHGLTKQLGIVTTGIPLTSPTGGSPCRVGLEATVTTWQGTDQCFLEESDGLLRIHCTSLSGGSIQLDPSAVLFLFPGRRHP